MKKWTQLPNVSRKPKIETMPKPTTRDIKLVHGGGFIHSQMVLKKTPPSNWSTGIVSYSQSLAAPAFFVINDTLTFKGRWVLVHCIFDSSCAFNCLRLRNGPVLRPCFRPCFWPRNGWFNEIVFITRVSRQIIFVTVSLFRLEHIVDYEAQVWRDGQELLHFDLVVGSPVPRSRQQIDNFDMHVNIINDDIVTVNNKWVVFVVSFGDLNNY